MLAKFKHLLGLFEDTPDTGLTLAHMHAQRNFTHALSIATNPNFFYGPFSGLITSNAGHAFVPAMFSNYTADRPGGHLSRAALMQFFAVWESDAGELSHRAGHERIPDNWWRRPKGLVPDYGTALFAADFLALATRNPGLLKLGGNTGKVNSFAGVDVGAITGGVYNVLDLLAPDKLVCFLFQLLQTAVPDMLQGGLLGGLLNIALRLLTTTLVPLFDPKCPGINQYNGELFKKFPGAGPRPL